MSFFWNALGMGTNSSGVSSGVSSSSNRNNNYNMETEEPKPKTPRYGKSAETPAKRRPKQTQNNDYLISSISEMPPPPPRNFEGSRNINDRLPFQDSLTARMPKSIKEAEKNRKEAEREAERIRKEADKETERLRKEAERIRKEADKETERLRKEAEKERSSRNTYSEPKPAYNFSSFHNASSQRANANASSHSFKPGDYGFKPSASSYNSNSNSNSSRNANPNSRTSSVNAQTSRLLEIIGLNQATTEVTGENIKKAYRLMAKKTHPDKNTDDPNATKKFQSVNAAYEQLKPMYNIAGGYSKKNKSQKRRRTNKKR